MPHGYPDYQPMSTPTMPDYGVGQVVWFQSQSETVPDGESFDLINYVVPDDMELRVCFGIISCEAPRTQKFNFITTPAGDWVSPTSHIDDDDAWTFEDMAYDGDIATASTIRADDHYLQLILTSPSNCDKVRIYAVTYDAIAGTLNDPDVSIDIYDGTNWVNIFSGVITKKTWIEKAFLAQVVYKARVKWDSGLGARIVGLLYEFQFDITGETAQETIFFDTYAVIPYFPEAPYPVPSGATFILRVWNEDEDDQEFSANLAGFLQAKV